MHFIMDVDTFYHGCRHILSRFCFFFPNFAGNKNEPKITFKKLYLIMTLRTVFHTVNFFFQFCASPLQYTIVGLSYIKIFDILYRLIYLSLKTHIMILKSYSDTKPSPFLKIIVDPLTSFRYKHRDSL